MGFFIVRVSIFSVFVGVRVWLVLGCGVGLEVCWVKIWGIKGGSCGEFRNFIYF